MEQTEVIFGQRVLEAARQCVEQRNKSGYLDQIGVFVTELILDRGAKLIPMEPAVGRSRGDRSVMVALAAMIGCSVVTLRRALKLCVQSNVLYVQKEKPNSTWVGWITVADGGYDGGFAPGAYLNEWHEQLAEYRASRLTKNQRVQFDAEAALVRAVDEFEAAQVAAEEDMDYSALAVKLLDLVIERASGDDELKRKYWVLADEYAKLQKSYNRAITELERLQRPQNGIPAAQISKLRALVR